MALSLDGLIQEFSQMVDTNPAVVYYLLFGVAPIVILVVWLGGVFVLALAGVNVGLRKVYVKIMIKIFEKCKQRIERYNIKINSSHHLSKDCDNFEDDNNEEQSNNLSDDVMMPLIARNEVLTWEGKKLRRNPESLGTLSRRAGEQFHLAHAMDLAKLGLEAIIEDEVTTRFNAAELPSWNLLTRTNRNYQFISLRMTVLWWVGFLFRYGFLVPIRVILLIFGLTLLTLSMALLGCVSEGQRKERLNQSLLLMCYRILSRAFSAIITYHDSQNKAKPGGICVANHTSPIDVVILATDNCYAFIGQRHGGFLGMLQKSVSNGSAHIWFERSESSDRSYVSNRLKQHAESGDKLPVLIFPEGTCINNTSVMQFKKGTFEIDTTIYPAAIKYDSRFGDPFWNSSEQSMVQHLIAIMSSWAIVCDVWYLPPMTRNPGESAIAFANRVKGEIARKGGLVDLEWDGQLKRSKVKEQWKKPTQDLISQHMKLE